MNDASTDPDTIRRWWTSWPDASILVRTGAAPEGAGVWVLDLDAGTDALATVERAAALAGDPDGSSWATRTARTGGGGLHCVYRYGPELAAWLTAERLTLPSRNTIGKVAGLDVRSDGGYIVAVPSLHASGRRYQWVDTRGETDAPPWLLRLVARPMDAERKAAPPPVTPSEGDTRHRRYGAAVLQSAVDAIVAATEGERHNTILRKARLVGGYVAGGAIDRTDAEGALIAAGEASGKGSSEVRAAVLWGLDEGAKQPIEVPDRPDYNRGGPMPDRDDYRDNAAPPPHDDDAPHTSGRADGPDVRPAREFPAPDPVAAHPWRWPPVEWLTEDPPRRAYLLHDRDPHALGERGAGLLPRGKVGLLAAAGGVGKTYALCGLALAVVTRRPWLGHFPVGEGCHGRAVLILGEEDPGELQRRLHVQARAMDLNREQRAAVAGIYALPGAGLDALALTQPEEHGTRAATPYAGALFEHLKRIADETGKGWDVVILDPLSRFAGPDVEKDNSAATRLIQVLERFTTLPGNPAVIVAHHTSQASRKEGPAELATAAATAVRGATGLTDGSRWVATLDEVAVSPLAKLPGHARFRVVKSNYGRVPPGSLLLTREEAGGGLRAATGAELDALTAAEEQAKREEGAKEARAKAAKREGAKEAGTPPPNRGA